jgi:threonine/homoserine/homoserine lactone efflux protein
MTDPQLIIAGIALLIFLLWIGWEVWSAERDSKRAGRDDLDQTEHGRVPK